MTDKNTEEFTDREILDLILSRLSALEEAEAERRKETRPLLDQISLHVAQIASDLGELKAEFRELNRGFERLAADQYKQGGRLGDLEARILQIERKPL